MISSMSFCTLSTRSRAFRRPLAMLLIIASLAVGLQASALAGQDKASAGKVVQLLEEAGYSYAKAADSVWTVDFHGKALPEFKLIATTNQDLVILFVIVAEKKDIKLTPEAMLKLLRLNDNLDRVKIGIDKEGDLFVRVDLSARALDGKEFKQNLDQVAAAADEVFAAIKPFIIAPKKAGS
jgi:hypothetical protein